MLYYQHEELKEVCALREEEILKLNEIILESENSIAGLRTWAQWDELAHEQFTQQLIDDGVNLKDFAQVDEEKKFKAKLMSKQAFIQSNYNQDKVEKYVMDLNKPFSLYGAQFQIGFSERVNLLERETVQIYKKRLYQFEGIEKYLKEKYDEDLDDAEKSFLNPL